MDLDRAQYWYSLAAKQGDRDAKKKLKELLRRT
jgi:TPR repeat protein